MTIPELKWQDFNHEIPEGTRIKVTDRNDQIYVAKNGQWELEITWTNCADAMPPSTPDWIIVSDGYGTHICDGMAVNHDYGICIDVEAKWTPYTPEKWKELNKWL